MSIFDWAMSHELRHQVKLRHEAERRDLRRREVEALEKIAAEAEGAYSKFYVTTVT